ncbi:hypothetical protein SSCG_05092 [Streptomyces clavuligerus]|nr:hypothetical protein SSCG_05092 [Streptomyces clavuligerus]
MGITARTLLCSSSALREPSGAPTAPTTPYTAERIGVRRKGAERHIGLRRAGRTDGSVEATARTVRPVPSAADWGSTTVHDT